MEVPGQWRCPDNGGARTMEVPGQWRCPDNRSPDKGGSTVQYLNAHTITQHLLITTYVIYCVCYDRLYRQQAVLVIASCNIALLPSYWYIAQPRMVLETWHYKTLGL